MSLTHSPYDGSHPLFRIGLAPLDLADWIEVDDGLGAAPLQPVTQCVAAVAFVGDQMFCRRHRADAILGRRIIARVSGRYGEHDRPALTVGDGMDLGRAPAFAATNSMGSRPLLRHPPSGAP